MKKLATPAGFILRVQSIAELEKALRLAAEAHHELAADDPDWQPWYARYIWDLAKLGQA